MSSKTFSPEAVIPHHAKQPQHTHTGIDTELEKLKNDFNFIGFLFDRNGENGRQGGI